jgi:hypothetical protein
MAKLFEFFAGTLRDRVSNTLGTRTNAPEFKVTGKGYAMQFVKASSQALYWGTGIANIGTEDFTIEMWLRGNPDGIADTWYLGNGSGGGQIGYSIFKSAANEVFLALQDSGGQIAFSSGYTIINELYLHLFITIDRDGVANCYIDNNLTGSPNVSAKSGTLVNTNGLTLGALTQAAVGASNSFIAKLRIDTGLRTDKDRIKSFREFERASQKGIQKHNFVLPKPTIDRTDGVVAHWNMKDRQGDLLLDISNNGNNGTINGALQTLDGMNFDGDDYIDCGDNNAFSFVSNDFSIWANVKASDISNSPRILSKRANAAGKLEYSLLLNATGRIELYVFDNGNATDYSIFQTPISVAVVDREIIISVSFNFTSLNANIFVNGVSQSISKTDIGGGFSNFANSDAAVNIGAWGGSFGFLTGQINDIVLLNRQTFLLEHDAYHQSFQKFEFKDDFRYDKADNTNIVPLNWINGTGDYALYTNTAFVSKYFDKGINFLQCQTAGTILHPQKLAYGKYRFMAYKGADANVWDYYFIDDNNSGYLFRIAADESISIQENTAGALTPVVASAASYVAITTWYMVEIARNSVVNEFFTGAINAFQGKIMGGAYGWNNWTVALAATVDATNTTSKQGRYDLDVSDRTAKLQVSNI